MTEELPLPLASKGERPLFLDNPESEALLNMLVALVGEVSALQDKVDSLSHLASSGKGFDLADLETLTPDAATRAARDKKRDAMLARVYRYILAQEERDAQRGEIYTSVMDEIAKDET